MKPKEYRMTQLREFIRLITDRRRKLLDEQRQYRVELDGLKEQERKVKNGRKII